MTAMHTLEATFPHGTCPIEGFGPLADSAAPIVLMYPDFFGRRPESRAVAQELAAEGWRVLMPEFFYDIMPYEPIPPQSIFAGGEYREKLGAMIGRITQARIDADTAALLAFVDAELGSAAPIATTGYCMGGRYCLTTACASPRVRFAGAIHAGNIAPAEGDSAHHRFALAKGRIYIGVAGIDPMYGAEEHGRLAQALREADTDHVIETYHGCGHGWVFPDIQVYDAAAAARHMRRLKQHMAEVFA